jgi:hypothetical protein
VLGAATGSLTCLVLVINREEGALSMSPLSRTSRRLTAGVAVASAAILLPAAALAASASQNAPTRRSVPLAPRCAAARPALPGGAFVWSANPGDGFAGGSAYELEVTNTGHRYCTVRGTPGAAFESGGHRVGGRLPASARGPLITLAPGATAHFRLTVYEAGAICAKPVTAEIVIYLPGQSKGQMAWLTAAACRGKRGGGVLRTGVLKRGTGIPLYGI